LEPSGCSPSAENPQTKTEQLATRAIAEETETIVFFIFWIAVAKFTDKWGIAATKFNFE
jgi:hypothetical protein